MISSHSLVSGRINPDDGHNESPTRRLRYPHRDLMGPLLTLMPELSGSAFKVAVTLASLMGRQNDGSWRCWPGYERIKADSGIKKDHTISLALKDLVTAKIISKKRRRNISTVYTWTLDTPKMGISGNAHSGSRNCRKTAQPDTPKMGNLPYTNDQKPFNNTNRGGLSSTSNNDICSKRTLTPFRVSSKSAVPASCKAEQIYESSKLTQILKAVGLNTPEDLQRAVNHTSAKGHGAASPELFVAKVIDLQGNSTISNIPGAAIGFFKKNIGLPSDQSIEQVTAALKATRKDKS